MNQKLIEPWVQIMRPLSDEERQRLESNVQKTSIPHCVDGCGDDHRADIL